MNKYPEDRKDPEEKSMAGTDFIVSIVLLLFSGIVIIWSLQMPRPGGWISAPGIVPLFLSAGLLIMGVGLLVLSLRNRGFPEMVKKYREFSWSRSLTEKSGIKRSFWIIGLTGLYVVVLLGRMPFELASFIYLASTVYIFWKKLGWLKIILLSSLLPLTISFIFRVIFIVFMPGDCVFDWILKYFK